MSSSESESTEELYYSDEEMDDFLHADLFTHIERNGKVNALQRRLRNRADIEAYEKWANATLNDYDRTDTLWLQQQGRLLWGENNVLIRNRYVVDIGCAIRDANVHNCFCSTTNKAVNIGRVEFNQWACAVIDCDRFYEEMDSALTIIIHDTISLKYQKVTDFFWNVRSLLQDTRVALFQNFDVVANHITEIVRDSDWMINTDRFHFDTTTTRNARLENLLRLGNLNASYRCSTMYDSSNQQTSVTLHSGDLHLRGTEYHPNHMNIGSWKWIDASVLHPIHRQTGEKMLFGYDTTTCTLVDKLYQHLNAMHEDPTDQTAIDSVAKCRMDICNYRTWIQSASASIGSVLDTFFPMLDTHATKERLCLSPYARRFSPVGDMTYNRGLFVYPKGFPIDDVYDGDWASDVNFGFLKAFSKQLTGGWMISSGLKEIRRCCSTWQAITADANFLFEPTDWNWDLVLPDAIMQSIFSIDRCSDTHVFPCDELKSASDNWYFTIIDLFDGIRSVQCDWCQQICNAPNTRILCKVHNIEDGTMLDYILHALTEVTGMAKADLLKSYPPVAKCDRAYNFCNHWLCEGLEFQVKRLQSLPVGRVCATCLQSDWIYCSDFNMQVSASDGFGFFHQKRSGICTKRAC